jgi:hypothetical protein
MKQSSQLLLIIHFCLYAISPRGLALFDLPSSWANPVASLHDSASAMGSPFFGWRAEAVAGQYVP